MRLTFFVRLLTILYFVLSLAYYYSDNVAYRGGAYFLGMLAFLIVIYKVKRIFTLVLPVVIVLSLFSLVNMLFYQREYFSIINVFSSLGIALGILYFSKADFIKYILLGIGLHIIYHVITGGVGNDYLPNRSHNHVSAIIVPIAAMILFNDFLRYKKIKISTVVICLVATVAVFMAIGRSGIVTMAMIMGGVLLFLVRNRAKTLIYIISGVLSILVIMDFVGISFMDFMDFSRFYSRGIESGTRIDLISQYYSNLDFETTLIGVEREDVEYAGGHNVHNSFLEIHSKVGIGILIVIYMIVFSSIRIQRINIGLLFIYMAVILRCTTDTILLFSGFYAGIFLFYIYYAFRLNFDSKNEINLNSSSV